MFFETNYNKHKFYEQYSLPLLVQSVGNKYPQKPIDRPAGIGYHQFIWVTKGSGVFTVNGERRILKADSGCFMRKDACYSYHADGGEFETAWFAFFGCDALLDFYGTGAHFWWEVRPQITRYFDGLYRLCSHNSTPVSRSAEGYAMLCNLLDAHFAPVAPLAQRVDALLENQFHRDVSLDEIAALVGVDKFALCHRYHDAQGVSVMEQLQRIRIAKAKQYLGATAHPSAYIGELCGFHDASYFTKVFHRATGLTPSAWRLYQSKKDEVTSAKAKLSERIKMGFK